MIVVGASTTVDALLRIGAEGDRCRAILAKRQRLLAPHHFRAEVLNGIRGLYLGRLVTEDKALVAVGQLAALPVQLPRNPVMHFPRIWELRHNLTAYDAAYVAMAEERGCPLVTADARLARAPGLRCEVILATAA